MCEQVEAVLARKDQISLEESLLLSGDVLAVIGYVLLGKTKVNHPDFMEVVLVASY